MVRTDVRAEDQLPQAEHRKLFRDLRGMTANVIEAVDPSSTYSDHFLKPDILPDIDTPHGFDHYADLLKELLEHCARLHPNVEEKLLQVGHHLVDVHLLHIHRDVHLEAELTEYQKTRKAHERFVSNCFLFGTFSFLAHQHCVE